MEERPRSRARALSAYGLVAFGPLLAWVAWISWSDDRASGAMNALWYASVAIAWVTAGSLAPRGSGHSLMVTGVAVISTMTTIFFWWSSRDSGGLFLIGVVVVAPVIMVGAVVSVFLGRYLSRSRARTG